MRERQQLETSITTIKSIETDLSDNIELIEMGEEEGDESVVNDAEAAIGVMSKDLGRRQTAALLSGEVDGNDCYLEVHSGAGGTESQDWANMLLRRSEERRVGKEC